MHVRKSLFAALTVLLAGCTSLNNIQRTDAEAREATATADNAVADMQAGARANLNDNVHYNEQYVDLTPIVMTKAEQLPSHCDLTFSPAGGQTLLQVSQFITKVCGLQVRVTPDALVATGLMPSATNRQAGNSAPPVMTGPTPLPPGVSLPPAAPGASTYGLGGYGDASSTMQFVDVRYAGDLAGFLDTVTARFGLSWRVDRGNVVIFQSETRIFKVYNLPRAIDTTTVLSSGTVTTQGVTQGQTSGSSSSGSGGAGGQTGSMQSTKLSLLNNPADDLVNAITAMVSPGAPKPVYAASTNTVVVNDTPDVLDRVQTYVDDLNVTYSKQVLLNVQVLSVTLNNTDSYGINWTAVYKNVASNFGVQLTNSYSASNGAVSGAINILSGNSKWAGSQALIKALATQGTVKVVTEPSVLARNLKPTPVQIAEQQGYIYQETNTVSSGTGGFSQSGMQPGSITTGFNMEALPFIFPDNKTIELALNINISDLIAIVRKESGDSAIETPNFTTKQFAPDVQLRSGETAVIASFKQSGADNERSGVGSPYNWLFGGGITGTRKSVYVVILVTPIIKAEKVPASVVAGTAR